MMRFCSAAVFAASISSASSTNDGIGAGSIQTEDFNVSGASVKAGVSTKKKSSQGGSSTQLRGAPGSAINDVFELFSPSDVPKSDVIHDANKQAKLSISSGMTAVPKLSTKKKPSHFSLSLVQDKKLDHDSIDNSQPLQSQNDAVAVGSTKEHFETPKSNDQNSFDLSTFEDSSGCNFVPKPLNYQNQFETNLIEASAGVVVGLGALAFPPSIAALGLTTAVFTIAGAIAGGQLSATYATDPNEDRFKAIEKFSSCVEDEFKLLWKAIEDIHLEFDKITRNTHRLFFQEAYGELLKMKENFVEGEMMSLSQCLESVLVSDGTYQFKDTSSLCGMMPLGGIGDYLKEDATALKHSLIKFGDLYIEQATSEAHNNRDKPYPVMGRTTEFWPVMGNTESNDGFDDTYIHKLSYGDMRVLLRELTHMGNLLLLGLSHAREWALTRDLYRIPGLFSRLWRNLEAASEDLIFGFQYLHDKLMTSSPATGNLPNLRILTSDNYNSKIFCLDVLRLKPGAPSWCKNMEPEGWIMDKPYGESRYQCPAHPEELDSASFAARGCWIGNGKCDLTNFCSLCVDWDYQHLPDGVNLQECVKADNGKVCALDDTPQLDHSNKYYKDQGPSTWPFRKNKPEPNKPDDPMYGSGVAVDPIINELKEIRRTTAFATSLNSYWKKEKGLLSTSITNQCSPTTKLYIGVHLQDVACPKPNNSARCETSDGVVCGSKNVASKELCGSISYSKDKCMCGTERIAKTKSGRNAEKCGGTERYVCRQDCGWLWCEDVYCTRDKYCSWTYYQETAADCEINKTCMIADDCACHIV